MAEINPNHSGNGKRAGPRRRSSTKVDMTAMVDVAFLLLTFFVLTATLTDNYIIETVLPPPCEDCRQEVDDRKILTVVLDENDQIYYYLGLEEATVEKTHYGANGLRKIITDHLNRYPNRCKETPGPGCWDPIISIKARNKSRYVNLVDALDELTITQAPKYVIADFLPEDSLLIRQQYPTEIVSKNP